jgi:hypothetical protein
MLRGIRLQIPPPPNLSPHLFKDFVDTIIAVKLLYKEMRDS